jgi:hypothetical protein
MHNLDIGANAATATRALRRSQSRLLVASAVNSMLASIQTFGDLCSIDRCDEGFSMRATAQGFGVGLTLARVDKPLKEEAVGC